MTTNGNAPRPLALVTGASTGIGYELATLCAQDGFDLLVAADDPKIEEAAAAFRQRGAEVTVVEADLAALEGVDQLCDAAAGRPIEALLANAGHGLGQNLIQKVGRGMRDRGHGRILTTGSVAGYMPGSFHAGYNGTKAFIDSFSYALRNELKETGVTVTGTGKKSA